MKKNARMWGAGLIIFIILAAAGYFIYQRSRVSADSADSTMNVGNKYLVIYRSGNKEILDKDDLKNGCRRKTSSVGNSIDGKNIEYSNVLYFDMRGTVSGKTDRGWYGSADCPVTEIHKIWKATFTQTNANTSNTSAN